MSFSASFAAEQALDVEAPTDGQIARMKIADFPTAAFHYPNCIPLPPVAWN